MRLEETSTFEQSVFQPLFNIPALRRMDVVEKYKRRAKRAPADASLTIAVCGKIAGTLDVEPAALLARPATAQRWRR